MGGLFDSRLLLLMIVLAPMATGQINLEPLDTRCPPQPDTCESECRYSPCDGTDLCCRYTCGHVCLPLGTTTPPSTTISVPTSTSTSAEKSLEPSKLSIAVVAGCITGGLGVVVVIVLAAVFSRKYKVEIICKCKFKKKNDHLNGGNNTTRDAVRTEQSPATSDPLLMYKTADISDSSSHYTTLTDKDNAANLYASLHSIELQETQHSTDLYENVEN